MRPTADQLSEQLSYDGQTGFLTWKRSGKTAGCSDKGYVRLNVMGRMQYAHRVVWCMVTGQWPEHWIDHVDTDRSNNRFTNLRLASRSENLRNTGAYRNNKSGAKGACKKGGKFRAQITVDGRTKYLGSFSTPQEASAAYLEAATELAPAFARAS